MGTQMMNGIGVSGDFARRAGLCIVTAPGLAGLRGLRLPVRTGPA